MTETTHPCPPAATEVATGLFVRGFAPPLSLRDFGLIAFDMDSTLINIECVDEIAAAAGRKAEVAAITEAAMRGEITDYKQSLRQRVALLAGVPVSHLEAVYRDVLQLNPGVERLVSSRKKRRKTCSRAAAGTPGPLSATTISAGPSVPLRSSTAMRPRSGVYLIALSSRFASAWNSRSRSPSNCTSSAIDTTRCCSRASASGS